MLINGNVCPVTGNIFTATNIFTNACITRLKTKLTASKLPKTLSVFLSK